MQVLAQTGRTVLDILLPPSCAGCDAPVEIPGQLCAACFTTIDFITPPLCESCGLPFVNVSQSICAGCVAKPPVWTRARAAFLYDDASKNLVLGLKYTGREENAPALALHMARAGADLLRDAEILVPVPLHRRRLLHRRYNQAALLAHALTRRGFAKTVPDALCRLRSTAALAELSAAKRETLLHGAIAIRPSRANTVAGRRILLIDDVLTSGATANACARALLDAGAANVDLLVASRVPHPGA